MAKIWFILALSLNFGYSFALSLNENVDAPHLALTAKKRDSPNADIILPNQVDRFVFRDRSLQNVLSGQAKGNEHAVLEANSPEEKKSKESAEPLQETSGHDKNKETSDEKSIDKNKESANAKNGPSSNFKSESDAMGHELASYLKPNESEKAGGPEFKESNIAHDIQGLKSNNTVNNTSNMPTDIKDPKLMTIDVKNKTLVIEDPKQNVVVAENKNAIAHDVKDSDTERQEKVCGEKSLIEVLELLSSVNQDESSNASCKKIHEKMECLSNAMESNPLMKGMMSPFRSWPEQMKFAQRICRKNSVKKRKFATLAQCIKVNINKIDGFLVSNSRKIFELQRSVSEEVPKASVDSAMNILHCIQRVYLELKARNFIKQYCEKEALEVYRETIRGILMPRVLLCPKDAFSEDNPHFQVFKKYFHLFEDLIPSETNPEH